MNIRLENQTDYQAIAQIHELAFGQKNEAYLVEKISVSPYYIPELSLIVEFDNSVIAHLMLSYIHLVNQETFQVIGLAPVSLHPNFQNKGIGSNLVNNAINKANGLGEALVIVLGHPQFYSRFGFKPSTNFDIKSPFSVPEENFMAKPLTNYLSKYKGEVVYPEAFQSV